jgi:hypothetical protein
MCERTSTLFLFVGASQVRKLSENEAEQIRALSHASQIPLAQRKRENEALRRRMKHPNLRAGLLQKYQSVQSDSAARSLCLHSPCPGNMCDMSLCMCVCLPA